jgi:hypothetical protein
MADSAELVATLRRCAERAQISPLTLGEVIDSLPESVYGLVCIILVLPFLQPFSLGPLAVVGGLTFAALGWQLYRGHPVPVLPERARQAVVSQQTWVRLINVCVKIVSWCRKFTRPRLQHWVNGRQGQRIEGLLLGGAGLLMAVPFFGLPFNNFLPGMAIFFTCVAELEDDGLMIVIAAGWLAVTVIYFTAVLVVLWLLGEQAIGFLGWKFPD